MKRLIITVLFFGALTVPFGQATSVAEAAPSCVDPPAGGATHNPKSIRVRLNGKPVEINGTMPNSQYVCPTGIPSGVALLSISVAKRDRTAGDFQLCVLGIDNTSDLKRSSMSAPVRYLGSECSTSAFSRRAERGFPTPCI